MTAMRAYAEKDRRGKTNLMELNGPKINTLLLMGSASKAPTIRRLGSVILYL